MKKKTFKKWLAAAMSAAMLVTMLPVGTMAAEDVPVADEERAYLRLPLTRRQSP